MIEEHRKFERTLYGTGQLEFSTTGLFGLIALEFLNLFYIWTLFTLALWFWGGYGNFALVLSALLFIAIFVSVNDQWASNKRIKKLAAYVCTV